MSLEILIVELLFQSAREQFLSSTQTAQTIMGAIPIEFTQLEAKACVEEFLLDRFVSRELVVEYAFHWGKKSDEEKIDYESI